MEPITNRDAEKIARLLHEADLARDRYDLEMTDEAWENYSGAMYLCRLAIYGVDVVGS